MIDNPEPNAKVQPKANVWLLNKNPVGIYHTGPTCNSCIRMVYIAMFIVVSIVYILLLLRESYIFQ